MQPDLLKNAARISIDFLKPALQAKVLKTMAFTRFRKNDPSKFIKFLKKNERGETAVLHAIYEEFCRSTFQQWWKIKFLLKFQFRILTEKTQGKTSKTQGQ